jgi:UDP-glucose 4-epimerase
LNSPSYGAHALLPWEHQQPASGPRRALVTGGAGFVGSHLVDHLLVAGWQVDVLDDLSTGRHSNLAHLAGHPHLNVTIGSVLDRRLLAPLVDRADVIFHLAAVVGVKLIARRPLRTLRVNIRGTENVLHLAARLRKPVLVTSSSEVYGSGVRFPFSERDSLVLGSSSERRWCYAASKLAAEHIAFSYGREGLPVVVVRLFNTIGPRQTARSGMVVPRLVAQALRGRPMTLYGDGRQRRSFTWVEDVVSAMVALIQLPGAFGDVINVGHPEEVSILDLASSIRAISNSASEIKFVSLEQTGRAESKDIGRRLPDVTRLTELIGFCPSKDLSQMLHHIVEHRRATSRSAQ